jgi:ABC-type lipopolysaccharide export system ATPase subunit
MIENIALILQVHEGLSREAAHKRAHQKLKVLELLHLANWRYDICSEKEIFYVQLIRAHMQKNAKIVIDQPFAFLAEEVDLGFIFTALDRLMIAYEEVLIIDLTGQKSHYKETACHIEK